MARVGVRVKGPSVAEAIAVTLLNEHSIKTPSKYLLLHPHIHAALSAHQLSFSVQLTAAGTETHN